MKQRTNFFISIVSLFTGGILYILFRGNTHLGKLFTQFSPIISFRTYLKPLASNLLRFHLPDFLWCLSLGCGLQAVLRLEKRNILLCGFGAFLCGAIWEYMQLLGVISGTGDFWDVVSYFLAGALCTIINLKETKK